MLTLRQLIPPLTARTPQGRTVRAWDFKQKRNLVIAFLHTDCRPCEEFLCALAAHAAELDECEARALIVFPEPPPAFLAENLPAQIVVAADFTGRSQRAFLGEAASRPAVRGCVGVFVADRYGELYAQWIAAEGNALPDAAEVLAWLARIEVTCEECGAPHWPAES